MQSARLDHYYQLIKTVILERQHPITGLLPASTAINAHGNYTDAWVRDNVYSILAVWGLSLAYRKVDIDHGRTFELEGSVVKLMRGLLFAMMRQADKVERFKETQSPGDALHAKYSTTTRAVVVGDHEWGHLQLDATSLYLLMLAQMTASGLNVILTIDEVNFVQNLVYYVGRAYQTPDYGIWERGDKINSGHPELNASSIGMAKAALESLNGLDLFGVRGSQASVLHILPDEVARARITLESLLPWESSSKEVDGALLGIIGFPAFAVEDAAMVNRTRRRVVERLQGRYGCKRFLRDGHQTAIEDISRLHYEPWELKQFEHLECEWPLFFTYLLLDAIFRGDEAAVDEYSERLEAVMVERGGIRLLPELYYVPRERVEAERAAPHSQERCPNENVPLVWAQSLYYLGGLLREGLLQRGDIDPLGRYLRVGAERDPVVQIALLSEDEALQRELEQHGIATQTPTQIAPTKVRQSRDLAAAYHHIGRNDKIGLTGRPIRRLRSLTTSKVFRIRGEVMVFLPSFLDAEQFYLTLDEKILVAQIRTELAYLRRHWRHLGRPTMTLLITRSMWETGFETLLKVFGEMQSGTCGNVPVRLGRLGELAARAGKERIDYLHDFEFDREPVQGRREQCLFLPSRPAANCELDEGQRREIDELAAHGHLAALTERLFASRNLFEQAALLDALHRACGPDYHVGREASVAELLEAIYMQAARGDENKRPYWSVLRHAAALLEKVDFGLGDAITDILVRQKQVVVGYEYREDFIIARPLLPLHLIQKIRDAVSEPRDAVLTQEILIFLGMVVKREPQLLEGVITLHTGWMIQLIAHELAQELNVSPAQAYGQLMNLSPSQIKERLRRVLMHGDDVEDVEDEAANQGEMTWHRWRLRQGSVGRVPPEFYPQVWGLLRHCRGLNFGHNRHGQWRLESEPILSEMTADEKNFALWLELFLNRTASPEQRQLHIECLQALARLTQSNAAFHIDDYVNIEQVLTAAAQRAWQERHDAQPHDNAPGDFDAPFWQNFYQCSPEQSERCILSALEALASGQQRSV